MEQTKLPADSLLLQEVNELYITILTEVPLQPVFSECLEILNVSNINVPRCPRVHSQSKLRVQRSRIFTPANFKASIVQTESLV